MLKQLHVKNFAIIEDVNVEFFNGMTALTGGTGAGKSLIIDSLSLLFGDRADGDMIRYGEEKAVVEGVFLPSEQVTQVLIKEGIPVLPEMSIKREIFVTAKNMVKVNNTAVSLVQLKKIALLMADIHVQNDTFKLVNPDNYLYLLDQFGNQNFLNANNEYQMALIEYKQNYQRYHGALSKSKQMNDKIDMLKFQYQELSQLNLRLGEEDELNEIVQKLSNFDKHFNELNLAYNLIDGDVSILNNLYEVMTHLNKIKEIDQAFTEADEKIQSFYYELAEIKERIKNEIDTLDFNPNVLDKAQTRMVELKAITKKYQKSIDELIAYQKTIKEDIDLQENYDETINDYHNELKNAHHNVVKKAEKLSEIRQEIAIELEKKLINEMQSLELNKAQFKIDFKKPDLSNPLNTNAFQETGIDVIDFLISLNPGEPMKPLSKVASGGEMSRIMLAFKTIFTAVQKISLVVFDEIDMGISGYVASQVAKKMKEISQNTQVLCITHLPQVAGVADYHLLIQKQETDGRTKTQLTYLNHDERVKEIAMMLSGERITSGALIAAEELLK